MTTYQHGQQPDGAPVTWERTETRSIVQLNGMPSGLRPFLSEIDADAIARAFHLAKLAEDAAEVMCDLDTVGAADWRRRYRETVR